MAEVKFKFTGDDSELRKKLANLSKIQAEMTDRLDSDVARIMSGANTKVFKDLAKDAVNAAREAEILNRTASSNSITKAKLDQLEAMKRLREERAREISELNTLKQIESEAKTVLAEKKLVSEGLAQTEKALNVEYLKSGKALSDYSLKLKQQAEERRKSTEEERKAEKALREAERARKTAEREAAKQARETEKRKKQLERESSEYYKLNKALGTVRNEAKDVGAEMFRLERLGYKNTLGYEALRRKFEELAEQANIMDTGIKKIDASLGLHQRNVGNYSGALELLGPQFDSINQKLSLFGTSIDDLAGKPGAIKELGASLVTMGKGLLAFLVSPIGLVIAGLTSLFMLFKGNKQTVIDFNNGMLNVSKTTGMSGEALQILSNDVIQLSRSLKTVGTNKLTEYASIAGQLGVKGRADLMAFTEALAKLETASDISGEEGGKEIARLLTLVDGGVHNVKLFGDEIVNLGNNFAASEKEILGNAEAISQNVGIYKIGRQDVLAYATATKALGVEAEVVGSTFQKTLGSFEKSIRTGKGLADVLKVVGGSAADLQARFNKDASGVFQDYIKGLNAIEKAGGSVNAQMDRNGITDIRQRRVIGTLAVGYDTLARAMDTAKNAAGAMDEEFETASSKIVNQQERMGIAWDNFVLSIENGTGVIGQSSVAVMGFFADIIDAITPATSAAEKFSNQFLKQENNFNKTNSALTPLLAKYDELKSKGKLNVTEQNELKSVVEKIAKLMPNAVSGWDSLGRALDINRGKVNDLIDTYKNLVIEMKKSSTEDLSKDFEKSNQRAKHYSQELNKLNTTDGGTFLFSSREKVINDYANKIDQAKREALETAKKIQEIGANLTDSQRDLLIEYNQLHANIKDVELPSQFRKNKNKPFSEEESEKERARREKAEEAAARKASQAAERARQALEKQRSVQAQIDQLAEQSHRNRLSEDQEQIASIQDKYAKAREEVRKFYADPKNAGLKVDSGKLVQAEKFEISEVNTRQGTKALIKELAIQKSLLDEYNSYAERTSIEEANKRFEGQLSLVQGYKTKLQQELMAILAVEQTASIDGAKGTAVQLTQAQKERVELLQKELENLDKQERTRADNKYIELLKLSETNEIKIAAIRKRYQDAYELLETEKTKFTEEEFEKRKVALEKSMKEELSAVILPDFKKSSDWVNVFEKTAQIAKDKVQESIASLRDSLKKMLTAGEITIEQYDEALKQIKGVEIQVRVSERGFARLKQILKELREAEKGSVLYEQARKNLGSEIDYWGKGIAEAGRELGGIFDQLGVGSEKFKEDMALTMNLVSDASALATSIASGDVVGMVVNGIKTISSAISLFTKDRKIERRIQEYQAQLEQLGKTYEDLARKMSGSDTNYYENSNQLLKNLEAQEQKIKQMMAAEDSKKKTDKEKMKSYQDQLKAIQTSREDLEKAIRDMRLQTDINTLANSITNALVGAFEAGEDGIDAMNKSFEKFIKDSLANSARLKFVQNIIDDMMNDVDKYMSSNGNSIVGYDFENFRNKLNKANKEVFDFLESAYSGLKLEKDGDSNSSLKAESGIERITEQTGSEIVGTFRAGYDQWKLQNITLQSIDSKFGQYLIFSNEKLAALNAIQVNTANTVVRLDQAVTELQGIRQALR